jgi:hypothetical protein
VAMGRTYREKVFEGFVLLFYSLKLLSEQIYTISILSMFLFLPECPDTIS